MNAAAGVLQEKKKEVKGEREKSKCSFLLPDAGILSLYVRVSLF